jgi:hypothetical protein
VKQTTKETTVITPTARVTAARLAVRAARPRRLTSILLWAVQIPLAALFAYFALAKLTGQLVQEFTDIGAGQWLRYFSGTAELAGAIGLLTPCPYSSPTADGSRSRALRQPSADNGRPARHR